jgi:hypothetical protein
VRSFTEARRAEGVGNCLLVTTWCYQAWTGAQTRDGSVPFLAQLCGHALAPDLQFRTSLEVEFVVENTKGQRVDAYSAHYPARPNLHVLRPSTIGTCYEWTTSWSGRRPDGSRVPGAYVVQIVVMTQHSPVHQETLRFDLR